MAKSHTRPQSRLNHPDVARAHPDATPTPTKTGAPEGCCKNENPLPPFTRVCSPSDTMTHDTQASVTDSPCVLINGLAPGPAHVIPFQQIS
jgi:hypothetical protein